MNKIAIALAGVFAAILLASSTLFVVDQRREVRRGPDPARCAGCKSGPDRSGSDA
jgi:hypothetical protein